MISSTITSHNTFAGISALAKVGNGTPGAVEVWPFHRGAFGTKSSNLNTATVTTNEVVWSQKTKHIAVTSENIGYKAFVFEFNSSLNQIGTRLSSFPTPEYGININIIYDILFTNSSNAVIYSEGTVNTLSAAAFSNDTFSQPVSTSAFAAVAEKLDINNQDNVVVGGRSSGIFAYAFNSQVPSWGSEYSAPSSVITGGFRGIRWSPDNNTIYFFYTTSPYLAAYEWQPNGWGSKKSDPSTVPTVGAGVRKMETNKSGSYLALTGTSSPYINVYEISGSGFGSKLADPSTSPGVSGSGVDFDESGQYIAVKTGDGTGVMVYNFNNGFGTVISSPSSSVGLGNDFKFRGTSKI